MSHWRNSGDIGSFTPTTLKTLPTTQPPATPPPSPAPAPQPTSWWGTFIKTFTTNLVSSEFWNEEMSAGGCLNSFRSGVDKVDVLNALDAVPNSVEHTIGGATSDLAFGYASSTGVLGTGYFAASHALSCPGCSATFRAVVGNGAKVAEVFGAGYLALQTVAGSIKEYTDLLNGTCR
jgi:hypothetical protein